MSWLDRPVRPERPGLGHWDESAPRRYDDRDRGHQRGRRRMTDADLDMRRIRRFRAEFPRGLWARSPSRSPSPVEGRAFHAALRQKQREERRAKKQSSQLDRKEKRRKKRRKLLREAGLLSDEENEETPQAVQENEIEDNDSAEESDGDDNFGPAVPEYAIADALAESNPRVKTEKTDYGGDLLRGEGEATAAFLQKGERVPRRGEIGLSSKQIEVFEHMGYVMSGSRHKRMNAVRIRKEAQIFAAEEEKTLKTMRQQQRIEKERQASADTARMVDEARRRAREARQKHSSASDDKTKK
ncbi:MAG: hypothetical protein MHM6MM_005735 [Cercozoa sp. M6MM]